MSARDDYPLLAKHAEQPNGLLVNTSKEIASALDELEQLRRWKAEAECVIEEWDQLWEKAGCPGKLGETKAAGLLSALQSDGVI